jgi:hypothetical protein
MVLFLVFAGRSSIDLAPIYSFSKKRLYAALPGRTFICVKNYPPQEDGELDLKKGEFVEGEDYHYHSQEQCFNQTLTN